MKKVKTASLYGNCGIVKMQAIPLCVAIFFLAASFAPAQANGLLDNLVEYWTFNTAGATNGTTENETGAHASTVLVENNHIQSVPGHVYANARGCIASSSSYFSLADPGYHTVRSGIAWVHMSSIPTLRKSIYGQLDLTGGRSFYLTFRGDTDDRFELIVSHDGSTSVTVDSATFGVPSVDTWYMVYWEVDTVNDTIGMSVNGGTMDTVAYTQDTLYDATVPFGVGRIYNGGDWEANTTIFEGSIGPIALFDAPLTSQQVSDLYNSGSGLEYASFTSDSGPSPAILHYHRQQQAQQ